MSKESQRAWAKANLDKVAGYEKTWRANNREHVRAYERKHRYAKNLKARFGLTLEQYEEMNAKQGGLCKICGGRPTGRWTRLAVDHDHKTNKVRGLLCNRCNRNIGQMEDRPELLRRAADYLEGAL